jgi:hypothetical protein
MAVYCLYKIIMTVKNLLLGRDALAYDPITKVQIVLGYFYAKEVVEEVTAAVSFGFMGYVMFSNVRSFTNYLIKLIDSFTRHIVTLNDRSELIVYFLSLAYGIYFICALMMLQTSLPHAYINGL